MLKKPGVPFDDVSLRSAGTSGLVVLLAATGTGSAATSSRFDRDGISFAYPTSWFVTTQPLSNGINPRYVFTVSTDPVRRTARDLGPCLPGIASQLPKDAVLAYVREALGADRRGSLPPNADPRLRPRRLRQYRVGVGGTGSEPPPCLFPV